MRSFDQAQGESLPDSRLATRLRRLIPMAMTAAGIIFILTGVLINYFRNKQTASLGSSEMSKVGSVAGEIKVKNVAVDISGAVEKPGVYLIPYDSRIDNVLITAGGLSPKADRKYVSRYINLAQRVSDGMKIYIPSENEISSNTINQLPGNAINFSGLININTASLSELDSLPEIGVERANKIIAGRPYQNVTDLTSRGIVSKSVFEKIKDKITAN